jgi:hypothetical protein
MKRDDEQQSAIFAAALAGLLGAGIAVGCGSDGSRGNIDSNDTGGKSASSAGGAPGGSGGSHVQANGGTSALSADAGTYINVVSTDPIAFTDFVKMCDERGGFAQTNAHCAGSNLCKGLSYMEDGTTLFDHSCKGLNSCMGYSCIDTPKDSGLSGQELYEFGECGGCHFKEADPSTYVIFYPPGESESAAVEAFGKAPSKRLANIVAFGTQGVSDDGIQFSNMPSYRQKYSRAEIERVVEHIRGLQHPTLQYDVPSVE